MAFFDQKQDVFDIKLTSHGKKLLSEGKLNMEYYSFFDDDIVYDNRYASGTIAAEAFPEDQNKIETRIKEETPRLRTQVNFTGLEGKDRKEITPPYNDYSQFFNHGTLLSKAEIQQIIAAENENDYMGYMRAHRNIKALLADPSIANDIITMYKHDDEVGILKNYVMQEPLGNSKLGEQNYPSWEIQCYRGAITGSSEQLQRGRFPTIKIPQVGMETNLVTTARFNEDFAKDMNIAIQVNQSRKQMGLKELKVFPDGTFLDIQEGEFLLEIKEENVDYGRENFEIEVFLVDDEGSAKEKWTKLFFKPDMNITAPFTTQYVQNDSEANIKYVSPPEVQKLSNFLEIRFDENISESVICASRAELKDKTRFVDLNIDCEDMEVYSSPNQVSDIYGEGLVDPGEIC